MKGLKESIVGLGEVALKERNEGLAMSAIALDFLGLNIYQSLSSTLNLPADTFYSKSSLKSRIGPLVNAFNIEMSVLDRCRTIAINQLNQPKKSYSRPSGPSYEESSHVGPPTIKVVGLRVALNDGGFLRVMGKITNIGSKRVNFIYVGWDLIDQDGSILEQANEVVSGGLDPGVTFKIDHAINPRYTNSRVKLRKVETH